MFQDILMLAALFILRIAVPLLLVAGIGYTLAQRWTGVKLDFSPKFFTGVGLVLCIWAVAAIAIVLRLTSGSARSPTCRISSPWVCGSGST